MIESRNRKRKGEQRGGEAKNEYKMERKQERNQEEKKERAEETIGKNRSDRCKQKAQTHVTALPAVLFQSLATDKVTSGLRD